MSGVKWGVVVKKWKGFLAVFCLLVCVMGYAGKPAEAPPPTQEAVPLPPTPPPPSVQNAPVPPPLPSSTEMTHSYENAFVRMLVTLLGLLVLVFATVWVLRKLGRGKFRIGGGHAFNVVERRALSPKTMLYVVEIDNRRIFISESQLEVRMLTSLETTEES